MEENPFRESLECLRGMIARLDVPEECRATLDSETRQFVTAAISACLTNIRSQPADGTPGLESLLDYRRRTSGAMYGTFAQVLNLSHALDGERSRRVAELLTCWGVAVQVLDDLVDLTWDYQQDPNNVMWTLLAADPAEHSKIAALAEGRRVFIPPVLREKAPRTEKRLSDLMETYLGDIRSVEPTSLAINDGVNTIRSAFSALLSPMAGLWVRGLMSISAT